MVVPHRRRMVNPDADAGAGARAAKVIMSRTYVVTGAASGIGRATKDLLESRGEKAIGVDLHDADIEADLSTAEGRNELLPKVTELSGGSIDAVIAVAGVSAPANVTIKVNYFGAVATLENLRPLLAESEAPRAALVTSFSALQENDPELVDLMVSGDEAAAVARADALVAQDKGTLLYASSKRAIAEWIRSTSVSDE